MSSIYNNDNYIFSWIRIIEKNIPFITFRDFNSNVNDDIIINQYNNSVLHENNILSKYNNHIIYILLDPTHEIIIIISIFIKLIIYLYF
uniref:Uncharacterized protein n=1 Tax=viral metagenome TaxID=1070528 RepID=A0A6C0EE40_9ZZZZ